MTEAIRLEAADGVSLEAEREPPTDGSSPRAGMVLCHPHPVRGGTMDNVTVYAQNAYNRTAGSGAVAVQEIGKVSNGLMKNVTVYARGAVNNANNDGSYAEQKNGVVN